MPVYQTDQPPVRALVPTEPQPIVVADDLPSEELMASLDLQPRDFGDFIKAFQFIIYQSQGYNITKAAEAAGINRRLIYEDRWQSLAAKARRLFVGKLLLGVRAAADHVYEEWPKLVAQFVEEVKKPNIALGERTKALEFLYMAFITGSEVERPDDIEQRKYLIGARTDPLAPITAIQAQAGSTINVTVPVIRGETIDA